MKIVMAKTAVDFLRRDPLLTENNLAAAQCAANDAVKLLAERAKALAA